jgi:phosphoserine phosphatase
MRRVTGTPDAPSDAATTTMSADPSAQASHAPPFERIVFDCDSTLSRIEGIEELSGSHRAEIAELTAQAMDGRVPLQEVYGRRLELVRPSRNAVATVGRLYIESAVPQARETVAALRSLGKELRIVSGGLRMAVVTFAGWLGISDACVHAVKVRFDGDEHYMDFEREHPLARAGGKRAVLAGLPKRRTAFVGDGMTDAEAADVVDCFLCFGGVVARPAVAARAHVTVNEPSLAALLPALCTSAELDRLRRDPRHAVLLRSLPLPG